MKSESEKAELVGVYTDFYLFKSSGGQRTPWCGLQSVNRRSLLKTLISFKTYLWISMDC